MVRAWAPAAVLALWAQCRNGAGFHTWPEEEVIETVDTVSGLPVVAGNAGNLVWTGTGWYASAIVRLATGQPAMIVDQECPSCGRTTPRVMPTESGFGLLDAMATISGLDDWFGELQRTASGVGLVIWIAVVDAASAMTVMAQIHQNVGPAQVFITDLADVRRRIEDAKGERFGDRRALPNEMIAQ